MPNTPKRAPIKSSKGLTVYGFTSTQRKKPKTVSFTTDDFIWQCWQCLSAFSTSIDLDNHLRKCSSRNAADGDVILPVNDNLPGCPFCPRDGCQAEPKPYYLSDFDEHVQKQHPDVKQLTCPYCTNVIESESLSDLTSHILLVHEIHWRPSPASMVYQRTTDVAHRVVTCLGCGWCTFVLRAQDAVAPPASLASHMSRCAGKGARLSAPNLPSTSVRRPTRALIFKLTEASKSAGDAFAARFPGVRGYYSANIVAAESSTSGHEPDSSETMIDSPARRRLKYESSLRKTAPSIVKSATVKVDQSQVEEVRENVKKPVGEDNVNGIEPLVLPELKEEKVEKEEIQVEPSNGTIVESMQENIAESEAEKENEMVVIELGDQPDEQRRPQEVQQQTTSRKRAAGVLTPPPPIRGPLVPAGVFDVPLDLPPSPPRPAMEGEVNRNPPGRVYVCPICGDNALSTLRERDRHLVNEHSGELVFPCQLCGMAYPVYIALRRHAVLKHSSNFDAVLYGQVDMDPIECPYCELVAFTSPEVLQLHLAKFHPEQLEQQAVTSAVASALAQPDSEGENDENDRDWTETGENGPKSPAAVFTSLVPSDEDNVIPKRGRGGRGRGRRGRGRSLGAPIYTPGDLLDDPDFLETSESGRYRSPRGGRGRGRGRGRGALSSTSARSRGTGRPRGRPRGSTRASFGFHTAAMAGLDFPPPTESDHQQDENVHTLANATGSFEVTLAQTSPVHAPQCCRLCGPENPVVFDNPKEHCIHLELDHNPESTLEQLGCQACGRIFLGPHYRTDMIGHIRVAHQSEEEAITCPNQFAGCGAKFTSIRLRDSHLLISDTPGWSCPLNLHTESLQAVEEVTHVGGHPIASSIDTMILATEIAADAIGQMVLAYGCPLCSRVFVGENCTSRFLAHQSECNGNSSVGDQ
ncbi:unnamed protein product [Hymenolepis diminuta]|uniref:C2H2-type domain-containing protein n=1 Tax=Hymenolepis diminuta TaxID=6216 RepID=A0A564YAC2_HYMDI|nr:unnamed protein product [Hymenolepis diminuta]